MEDDAMIDRKSLREGDEVWVAHTGYHGDPFAHVYGGVVVATGDDGGFVYKKSDGRVDNVPAWNTTAIVAGSEADAWLAAASSLATLAAEVADKAAQCRVKALGEEVAA